MLWSMIFYEHAYFEQGEGKEVVKEEKGGGEEQEVEKEWRGGGKEKEERRMGRGRGRDRNRFQG